MTGRDSLSLVALMTTFSAGFFVSCSCPNSEATPENRNSDSTEATPENSDSSASPRRLVALSPSLASIIGDIGAGELIVGLSSYGTPPRGAEEAVKVGGFTDPSIESIIALRPDLVIGVPLQKRALGSCSQAGIPTLSIESQTIEDALEVYSKLGRTLGREAQAQQKRLELERRLDAVRQKARGRRSWRTLILLGQAEQDLQRVYPVTPGNFTHQLLEIAGGENVLTSSAPSVNAEMVIALAPEVIIEIAMDERGDVEDHRLETSPMWSRFSSLPAVQNGRVYSIASSSLLQPGPDLAHGAELLYELLHESQPSSL